MAHREPNPMVSPSALDWICDRWLAFWALVFGPRQIHEDATTVNAEQAATEINPMVSQNRLDLLFDYGLRAFFVGRPVGEKKIYPTPAPRTVPLPKPPKPPKAKADETAREANREADQIRAEARAADKAAKAEVANKRREAKLEAARIKAEALAADKVARAKADTEATARRREAEIKAAEALAADKLAEAQAEAEEIARRREADLIKANLPKPLPRLKPKRWWKHLWQQRQTPPPPPPAVIPPTNEAPPPPATPPEAATFEADEDHTDPHEVEKDPQIPHGASGLIRLGALGELRPLAAPKNPLGGPDGAEAPPVEEVHSLLDLRSSNEAREAARPKPPATLPPLPRQTLPEPVESATEVRPMRRITEPLLAVLVGPPNLDPPTEEADRLISKSDQAGLLRKAGFPDEPDDDDPPTDSREILQIVENHLNPPMSAEELAQDPEILEGYEKAFGVPHPGSGPQRVQQQTAQQFALGLEKLPFEMDKVEIEDEEPQTPTPPSLPPPPEEDLSGLIELEEVHEQPPLPAATTTSPTTTDDSAELAAMSDSFRSNRTLVGFLLGIFSFVYLVGAAIGTLSLFNQDSVEWWQYAITVSLLITPTIIAIVLLKRRRKQLAAA